MEFSIKSGDLAGRTSPCLILGVFKKRQLTAPTQLIDAASQGHLSRIIGKGDLDGEAGRTLLLHEVPALAAERVLLVGLGPQEKYDRKTYGKVMAAALARLNETSAHEALCALPASAPADLDLYLAVRDAVTTALDKDYRYERTKSEKKPPSPLQRLQLWVPDPAETGLAKQALRHGQAMARGVALAKELGNLPGNICTPTYLADQAETLAKDFPALKVTILEEADMAKLGMGALLSVSRGSRQPAKLIVMHHRGGKKGAKPLVLVGKGLTFDAGGISLKPGPDMDQMKYDMGGGASVLGTMRAALELQLPINLIGIIPASENLPDGDANKPGDIVTSLSGQTIEILNTDAEGRLILCDALTYCERFEPAVVIDIATLTGAIVVALGHVASGLFTTDEVLAGEILAAGDRAWDRAWRMPLWEDYQSLLDSNFADMANVGGREGGAVTAACFLSRYTKKYPWAHLDIAGTAWVSGKEKGGTGRPVPLLVQFLLQRSGEL
ncbi:MAG: leucyl aminopeptidase [Chromatiaceae bacterium]